MRNNQWLTTLVCHVRIVVAVIVVVGIAYIYISIPTTTQCCTQDCCPLDCKDSFTCTAYCCDGVSKHDCKSPCCNGE